jgi:propanol-preferring alcohol dehydrogenase
MMQLGFALPAIIGHDADVGFIGDGIDVRLFQRVSGKQTFHGSFGDNHADLSKVMVLATDGGIQHTIKAIGFERTDESLDLLRDNKIVGRAVVMS